MSSLIGGRARAGLILAAVVVHAGLAACGGSKRTVNEGATSPGVMTVRGDWDDVDAAVRVALTRSEMAILQRTAEPADDPDLVRYELISVRDDRAVLTAARTPGSGDALIPIRLEARVGAFGDPPQEQALLGAMAGRLEELAGVDYAPIRR